MKHLLALAVSVAAITIAPSANAEPCTNQACLSQPFSVAGAPYVGHWGAHGETVVVNADGSGVETYNGGTMTFTMATVSTDQPITAEGHITGGGHAPPGSWVTMQLVDGGKGMLFGAANGDRQFPFCRQQADGSAVNSMDCGA